MRKLGLMSGGSAGLEDESLTLPVLWVAGKATAVARYFSGALTLGLGFCLQKRVSSRF